jgi:hypothetical protein
MLDDEVLWGPMCGRFAVSLTVVLWLIAATIVPSFLGWFLTPHFHGSFSVGHCSGNCLFHWVFGPFLNVLYIWHSNCRLFNACLTEMRSRALRCKWDFGRSFTHHFWSSILSTILVNLGPVRADFSSGDF